MSPRQFLGPEVEELLHLMIELLNSSLENGVHFVTDLFGIFSNKSRLIGQFCAELNNEWRACQRLSSFRQGQLLYWIALMARSLFFFDPIHKFPRTIVFSHNFLNFNVKKCTFSLLNNIPKDSPIFDLFWNSILLKFSLTLLVLLQFQLFCDIDNFWVLWQPLITMTNNNTNE